MKRDLGENAMISVEISMSYLSLYKIPWVTSSETSLAIHVIKDTMDKTQGIIITHALNDNETLISGLTGVWQHPLNVKFSFLSFLALLSNKRNINAHCLYVYLLLCVCYFLLNRRKCVVRGQFQNSTTEIQSKLKSWKTNTH